MALPFVPSKRPFERHLMEPNGRGKWQKTSHSTSQSSQFKAPSGSAVFRVLCPSSKSGSVIGKGGGIIGKIRHETGAKIKLEDSVSGCDERVVVISGSAKDYELKSESMKHNDSEHNAEVGEDGKANPGENKDKEGFSVTDDSKLANATSLVQKALILIFERIIEGETVIDDGDEANKKFPSFRLLVFSNQVGCLLGKGGSVIKQMSTDSGAQIRILPRDKLPLCASQHDDIVQIVGGIDSIRKALQSVSQLLLENPPRERDFSSDNPPGTSHSHAPPPRQEAFNPTNYHKTAQGPPFSNKQPYDAPDLSSFPKFHEGPLPGQIPVTPDVLVFRLLCSNDKVGSVIGKAGNIVKALQHETGCEIKVLEIPSETEDRIIVISGPALPGDRVSPPQDALLRVQQRILMAVPDNKDNFVLSRMLVSSNQIGCLLGKGGSIITEMRKLSGAHIRVMSKDQIPKGVSENDEMVQVSGEFGAVREALLQITARLRGHLFRDKVPALNNPPHAPFIDQMPPFGSYMGRREPSPPRLYGVLPPFPKDAGAHAHEERPAFPHAIHGPGVALGADRVLPTSWAPQGMREGGGPMPIPDFGVAPSRNIGGFPGVTWRGNQSAVIPHTTVDVVVPRALVPSIYGEDGGCLRRIREISEAKITITDPRPEAKETVILISGTPEQMHAAQSLIQAFVLSETTMP